MMIYLIIITRYLNFNKEIIINKIVEDNKEYISLFRNKYKIKDKEEIVIINGKEKFELIACYKDIKKEEEDKLIMIIHKS